MFGGLADAAAFLPIGAGLCPEVVTETGITGFAIAGDGNGFGERCLWLRFDGCSLDRQRCRGKIAAEDFCDD
jgi:hypothetical protein